MGTLYIVSTPIGNLEDITLRAIRVLKEVDMIACEDTRHTKILISRYGINTPLTSYFQYNRIQKADFLIGKLREGKSIALVSDAGTPGISDPGAHIIKLAIDNKIPVIAIPGPTALIAALVVSGKPTHKFIFEGFLSNKASQRRKRLSRLAMENSLGGIPSRSTFHSLATGKELREEKRTIILYESPHRLAKMLADILDIFGDIELVIGREITKKFEEVRRGKTSALLEHFTATPPRGEFIIVI